MPRRVCIITAFLLFLGTGLTAQQSPRPYTEGPVVFAQYIRVKPGRFDDYMAYLAGAYKQLREEQKKAGIITGWSVYSSPGRDEEDWDVLLTTTYKNMAALDNLDDRSDPILKQIAGSLEKANEAMAKRGEMRDPVGSRLMRQLIIK